MYSAVSNVNSKTYIHILQHFLIPSVEIWFEDSTDFIFQNDNASCHRSKIIRNFLQQNNIKTMTWPANSPDHNPIKNIWAKLKNLIREKKPQNKDEFRLAIGSSWNEIS